MNEEKLSSSDTVCRIESRPLQALQIRASAVAGFEQTYI